jgi:hypothetical protein
VTGIDYSHEAVMRAKDFLQMTRTRTLFSLLMARFSFILDGYSRVRVILRAITSNLQKIRPPREESHECRRESIWLPL